MKTIMHRWTGAVVYHSETAQTRAEAVLECQKRASDAGGRADLQGADLQGAYLRGAAGLLLNGIPPLQIGGSRHWIIVRQPGYITIGCHHQTVAWWEEHYAATGRAEHYTAEQVEEYRRHIAYCREWMEARGVLAAEGAA